MEAIWVLFVIIAVIVKVLNKFGDLKTKLPDDWGETELPPIFKDWGFEWDEKIPDKELPEEESGLPEMAAAVSETTARDAKPEYVSQPAMETITDLKEPELEVHPLLSGDNIINGIILSEVLQPARARRHGLGLPARR